MSAVEFDCLDASCPGASTCLWEQLSSKDLPKNAFPAGKVNGEDAYIGRNESDEIVGHVYKQDGSWKLFDTRELKRNARSDFDVLVVKNKEKVDWKYNESPFTSIKESTVKTNLQLGADRRAAHIGMIEKDNQTHIGMVTQVTRNSNWGINVYGSRYEANFYVLIEEKKQ